MKNTEEILRKCAVLVMSLDPKAAALVLSRLSPHQVESISLEIARLETVGGEEQESVINQFLGTKTSGVDVSTGGITLAKELLRKAMGNEADPLIQRIEQSIEEKPFSFVRRIDPATLIQFLREEHPQTIAIILSHLPTNYCSEVLSGFDPEKQLEIVQRVAVVESADPDSVADLERAMELRLASVASGSNQKVGGVEHVAEILNVSERAIERNIMEGLQDEDPDLVEEIRHLMFVFEDIIKMNDKDVQTLLKNVETSKWAAD